MALHNLSSNACTVRVNLKSDQDEPWTDVFSNRSYDPFNGREEDAELDSFGYRWLR